MNCQVLMIVLFIAFAALTSPANGANNTTDCVQIADTLNATVAKPSSTLFASIANLTCNTGYRSVRSHNNSDVFEYIHCQSNGTWNASGCEPKDCGTIAAPPNATVANLGKTLFESIANVTCNNGYRIVGRNNNSDVFEHIQCQSNGMWNASFGCEPKAATSTQAPFGNATANGQDGSNSTVAVTTKTWDKNGCSRLEAVWFVIAILLPVATTNF